MSSVPAVQITVFERPECHLCETAVSTLSRIAMQYPFELVQVDITEDDALHRKYLERIPVVIFNGDELFDYFVDERILVSRLKEAALR